jgi:aminoacrylate hydrolase
MTSTERAEHAITVETTDGASLRAFSEGDGPPLLLVSGLGGTAGFWNAAATRFARSFRVIRFDQRGIGASTRGEAACTIDQLASDCVAVLDGMNATSAAFLGHSTGGCIGQAMVRMAPQRIDRLILSATWLKPSQYLTTLFGTRRDILDEDPHAYAVRAAMLSYPPRWLEANWHVVEGARAGAPTTPLAKRVVRERLDALLAFDGEATGPILEKPTLLIGARDDMIVPDFMQDDLAAALPHADKEELSWGGHFFPVTRPEVFETAVTNWVKDIN